MGDNWPALAATYIRHNTITGLVAGNTSVAVAQSNSLKLATTLPSLQGKVIRFLLPGDYAFYGDINVTGAREIEIGGGVTLTQVKAATSGSNTAHGLTAYGGPTGNKSWLYTADSPRYATAVTVDDATGLAVDDVVYATSADNWWWNESVKYTVGNLRRIVDITGNVVSLDVPLFRAMTVLNNARLIKIAMHPPIYVHGAGAIRHLNPRVNGPQFYNYGASFHWVEGLTWEGIEIYDCPNTGLELSAVWGGSVTGLYVHDLPDDNAQHLGYGVQLCGGTRNMHLDFVAARCRHGMTTNCILAPRGDNANWYGIASKSGEPEFLDIRIAVYNCTSQGVDTHEVGQYIKIQVIASGNCTANEAGGAAGMVIRSTHTTVTGFIGMASKPGSTPVGLLIDADKHALGAGFTFTGDGIVIDGGQRALTLNPKDGTIRLRNTRIVSPTQHAVRVDGGNAAGRVEITGMTIDNSVGNANVIGIYNNSDAPVDVSDLTIIGSLSAETFMGTPVGQRVMKRTQQTGCVVLWTGSAWPARPTVPAGEVIYKGPDSAGAPTDALTGDELVTW